MLNKRFKSIFMVKRFKSISQLAVITLSTKSRGQRFISGELEKEKQILLFINFFSIYFSQLNDSEYS